MGSHKLPDGREIVLCSFGLYEWSAVQEAALAYFKRSIIKTYTDNADLLPTDLRAEEIKRAFREAEKLTLRDLPRRTIKVPVVDDSGNQFTDRDGNPVMRDEPFDYSSWWMSDTLDGTLFCAWLSARKAPGQEHWTKQDVSDLFAAAGDQAVSEIDQAATTVARLSRSELAGNSSAPPTQRQTTEGNGMTARQRRMAERAARQKEQQRKTTA